MKKLFMSIYNYFHRCKKGSLFSTLTERNEFYVIVKKEKTYTCSGIFCDKKIVDNII